MLGTGLQFVRSHLEDRFYNPAKARRSAQNSENNKLRRAQSDGSESRASCGNQKPVGSVTNGESENRVGCQETRIPVASQSLEPVVKPLSNLERFLLSITPSVPAQYLSKSTMRGFETCNVEFQPYFMLGDLWESFQEWSAYGGGVSLVLNDSDSVVQYYVPYLSGIQIYVDSMKPPSKMRQPAEDSDSDFRDSSSDGSSDNELERELKYLTDQWGHNFLMNELPQRLDRLSFRDQHIALQDSFYSDDVEPVNPPGYLLFEYLEHNPPYGREPLADKILELAVHFPELKTLRSCDILPSSWISVAWYPIYRIPMGTTLKDLDACFLSYHSLATPIVGTLGAQAPKVTYQNEMDSAPEMSLPVFGLASHKFMGTLWTPNGGYERQLTSSLLQAADNWLRLLQILAAKLKAALCRLTERK